MKKAWKYFALSVLSLCVLSAASACNISNSQQSSSSDSSSETATAELTLRKSNIAMLLGDTTELVAVYNEIAGETLSYDSANDNVVSVSQDGVVEAMCVGSTTITVSYAGETATCNVSVELGEYVPVIEIAENQEEEIVTFRSEKVNLSVVAVFNGKRFNDVQATYEYSDESVGTVDENGLFIPAKTGKTRIDIKGNWRGQANSLMEKSVEITVKAGTVATINGGQTELSVYTVSSHGGQTYATSMPFAVTVTEDDGTTPVHDTTVSIIEGAELVEYKDDTLTSKGKYGTVIFAVQGQDEYHGEIYHEFEVEILRPVAESSYEGNLCAQDGSLDLDAMTKIFGTANTKVTGAESETTKVRVEDGKILGFTQTENAAPQAQKLTVYNDEVGYEISVKVYAGVIRTVSDFQKLITAPSDVQATKDNVKTLTGYFVLGNDIDASGETFASTGDGITSWYVSEFAKVGFRGIFDGQGYTVSNMDAPAFGIFGSLGQGAVVKNVAFTDVLLKSYADATFAGWAVGATFKNVYVSVAALNVASTAVVACNLDETSNVQNCVFEIKSFTAPSGSNPSYGVIGYMFDAVWSEDGKKDPIGWKDSYIIAPCVTIKSGYGYIVDCEYVDGKKTDKTDSLSYLNLTKMRRYTSWAAFIEDSETISATVDGFDKAFWNTDCGVPTWGTTTKLSVVKFGDKVAQQATNLLYGNGGKITVLGAGVGEIPCTVTVTSGSSVRITDNVLQTQALGESTVRVSYVYNGETITKDLTVTVIQPDPTASVTINGETKSKVVLVPTGKNTATIAVSGQIATLEILSGQEILEIEGLTVEVVAVGRATVRVKWTENTWEYYKDIEIISSSVAESENKTSVKLDKQYLYSNEDRELRLDFIDGITETASEILSVRYEGEELAFTINTSKNRVVFKEEIMTSVVLGGTASVLEVETPTKIYSLTYVTPVTKVFYESDDLFVDVDGKSYSYFNTSDGRFDGGYNPAAGYTAPAIQGVYFLGADIDLTNDPRVMRTNISKLGVGDNDAENMKGTICGFMGGFYGNGHTIKGMTVGSNGMFGVLGSCIVRDVAFTDVKFTQDANETYCYVLAFNIAGSGSWKAKLTNVYVSVAQAQDVNLTGNPTVQRFERSGILASHSSSVATYTNVVVDLSQLGEVNVVGRGVFEYGKSEAFSGSTNFYVIGKAPLILDYYFAGKGTAYAKITDADNKKNVDLTGKTYAWIFGQFSSTVGNIGRVTFNAEHVSYTSAGKVYRFESADEMKNSGVDFSALTATGYWQIENGVPVWKA